MGDWAWWSVDRSELIVLAGDVESSGSDCSGDGVVRHLEVDDHGQNGNEAPLSGMNGGRRGSDKKNRSYCCIGGCVCQYVCWHDNF